MPPVQWVTSSPATTSITFTLPRPSLASMNPWYKHGGCENVPSILLLGRSRTPE